MNLINNSSRHAIRCLTVAVILLWAQTLFAADVYKLGYYGTSVNSKAGYLAAIEKSQMGWRLIRIDFSGSRKNGPLVKHPTGPLAMSKCIIVPRLDGEVEVYAMNLELIWSFRVKSGRNIGPGALLQGEDTIALLTVSASEQRTYVEIYKVDLKSRKVQFVEEHDVTQVGGLVSYAENLWLIGKEGAERVIPKSVPE